MAITYEPIATTTLSSSQSSVTFSSISGSYTDWIVVVAGTVSAGVAIQLQFNDDTGTNYSETDLYGYGSGYGSGRGSNETGAYCGDMGTVQSNTIIQIMDYSNTTTYKTVLSRGNSTNGFAIARVAMWRNTSAITKVLAKLSSSATYSSGTVVTLYGVLAA